MVRVALIDTGSGVLILRTADRAILLQVETEDEAYRVCRERGFIL